jgi:hypothetical protein
MREFRDGIATNPRGEAPGAMSDTLLYLSSDDIGRIGLAAADYIDR